MENAPPLPEPSAPSETPNENASKPLYILDAFALMAYLQNESGQAQVENLLAQALNDECDVWMSLINWGEVVYTVAREQGNELANQVIEDIDRAPILLTHVTHVILNGVKNLSLCGGDSSQKRLRMTIPA